MKSMAKRIISILLSLVMLISVFSVGVASVRAASNINVLLIQDVDPWSKGANSSVLSSLKNSGKISNYTVVSSSEASNYNFSNYSLVMIPSNQGSSFYSYYKTYLSAKINTYVSNGGRVLISACTQSDTITLPNIISSVYYTASNNRIANANSPFVKSSYTGGSALTDSILTGNSCSHAYFPKNQLSASTDIILTETTNNYPTLIKYSYGSGSVVASALTWEFYYSTSGTFSANSYKDLILFAANSDGLSGSYETITPSSSKSVSITTAGTKKYFKFVPTVSGTYTFYSTGSYDSHGYVYNSSMTELENDDDDGDGYNFSITRSFTAGTTYYLACGMHSSSSTGSFTVYLSGAPDNTNPTGSISSTNNVATSQTVTLSLSDNVGVAGYYWGTSSSYYNNTYTSTSSSSVTKTISSNGTYYLTVEDTSENLSTTYSVTFYKTTLNANGGSVSPSYVITKSGNSFTRPTPTKTGYSFNGWATSSSATSGSTSSITPSSNSTYYAVWDYPTITSGSSKSISIEVEGDKKYYKFVPAYSGTYTFYSTGSYDSHGYVYDSSMNELENDDDDGSGYNFLISRYFSSGTTYYLACGMHSSSSTGYFTVNLVSGYYEDYEDPEDPEDYEDPGDDYGCDYDWVGWVDPTCQSQGYDLYECMECGDTYREYYGGYGSHSKRTTVTKATTSQNGQKIVKCTVCGKQISKSTVYYPKSISLSATRFVYDGKAKKPSVKVVDANGKTVSSSNYSVTYSSGRKNVGKYNVKIVFKGNYSGTVTKTFNVNPKGVDLTKLYSPQKAKMGISWKKGSGITGYDIRISTSKSFADKNTISLSFTQSKLSAVGSATSKKKYYVRIRTYKTVSGKNYYSNWSPTKSVTIK